MNEKYLKAKQEKLNVSLEELQEKWKEFEQEGKDLIPEDGLEKWVMFRIDKYYLKKEKNPVVEGKFQPLTISKNDYGATRDYIQCVKKFEDDPETAVLEKWTTADGTPLAQRGFNKGNPLELDKAVTITYDGYFIPKDSEKRITATFKIGLKEMEKISFTLGNIYEVAGYKSRKSTESHLFIIGSTDYVPTLAIERNFEQVKGDLKEYFEGKMVSIARAEEYYDAKSQSEETKYPLAVVKGDVYQLTITNDKVEAGIKLESNNRIELMERDEEYNTHTIGGWVVKCPELDFNFSENAQEVIMVGTLTRRKEKDSQREYIDFQNVLGIYVDPKWQKEETEPVENTEEVSDGDAVQEFVESSTSGSSW